MNRSRSFTMSKRKGKGPKRKYDLLIFGATGHLGQLLCEYLSRRVPPHVAEWGIAGRDTAKLASLKATLQFNRDLERLSAVVANCSDFESIMLMCEQTEIIINCVPNDVENSSVVVKACVECGTDYLDFSSEEAVIDHLKLNYDESAKDQEVFVVPACGYYCLPEDLGVLLTESQFPNDSTPNLSGFVDHTGASTLKSWRTCVESLSHATPKKLLTLPEYNEEIQRWVVPIPSIPSPPTTNVLERDTKVSKEPIRTLSHYSHYLKTRSLFQAVFLCILLVIVRLFLGLPLLRLISSSKRTLGLELGDSVATEITVIGSLPEHIPRPLLLESSQPQIVLSTPNSHVGNIGQKESNIGESKPIKKVVTTIWGPDLQSFSMLTMIACALSLLQNRDDLPITGGVARPSVAFGKHLLARLQATGVEFNVQVSRSGAGSKEGVIEGNQPTTEINSK